MNHVAEDILMHYGVSKLDGAPGRGSGRYPLGSGDNPNQRSGDFLARVNKLRKEGFTYTDETTGKTLTGDTAIARSMGLTTTQFRIQMSLASDEERSAKVATARRLREEGHSLNEIAKKMGYANDSSVRALLNEHTEARMKQSKVTAEYLKDIVDKKGMVDVGTGVEKELGISREKLNEALYILELEGYPNYGGGLPQVTNKGKQTNLKVLCPPGTEHKDIYEAFVNNGISSVIDYDKVLTEDGTKVRQAFQYPESLDSKRLQIRYAEQGGIEKDGVVELRRGVQDLSLGESNYAQVRILVDGTHYIKGMAVYSDDLPKGVDVLFNTNKKEGTPVLGEKDNTVLKPIKSDPDNPFGSLVKEHGGQSYYDDPNGKFNDPLTGNKQSLSLINKTREENDWNDWKDKLPSQFLGKQNINLVKNQLNLDIADRVQEYQEIKSLTNPTIKKAMLLDYAETCDKAAENLQAAALPRQKYQVILPLTSISDKEVYAPNYKNGEKVALIRYPHGGTFEIPILTVNNKNEEGLKVLGSNVKDAVGINSRVAERLSGADFDGDTVMVIPTGGKVKITSTPPLKGLEGFDPKLEYGPGSTDVPYKRMKATQLEMGKISNLITDMTLRGATDDELARAVKHSMVVIDAEKHGLDYQRSEKENGIAALKRKYQGREENGKYTESASTLISRASAQESVLKRQGSPRINEDGTLSYKIADNVEYTYYDKKGDPHTKYRMQKSTQMRETSDARTLISEANTPVENAYADYANKCKSLANDARKEYLATGNIKYNPQAKSIYQKEVDSLESKLNLALRNAPRERQAQLIANSKVEAKKQSNPDMKSKDIKKASQQALTKARIQVSAQRKPITFTDREWEAIQAGAISENKLSQMIKRADKDELRQRATPRTSTTLTDAKVNKIKAMKASGYTNAEIAEAIGCSTSTVNKYSN